MGLSLATKRYRQGSHPLANKMNDFGRGRTCNLLITWDVSIVVRRSAIEPQSRFVVVLMEFWSMFEVHNYSKILDEDRDAGVETFQQKFTYTR